MPAGADARGMRVAVTGSAGFIGRHLVRALHEAGAVVVGFDRGAAVGPAVHHQIELTDDRVRADLAAELAVADVVVHLAARAGVRAHGPEVDAARRRDNVLAAAVVLACTPASTPLVVTSSSSVYGGARVARGRPVPSHEDDPLWPRGAYARSKVLVERLCARRAAAGGAVTVVRPFTVCGPGQRPDMALARWLAAATAGRALELLGGPQRARDLTDVRHVARALAEIVSRAGEHGTVPSPLNLGTGRPVTLRSMVEAVATATGRAVEVVATPAPRDEPDLTCADTRRLHAVLGWVPETDLAAVVAAQAAARTGVEGMDLHSPVASANMA